MGSLGQFRSTVGLQQGLAVVVHTREVLSGKLLESGNSEARIKKIFRQNS